MGGVVAAGSEPTAEAGAEVLDAGGNAVDAVVAACFATASGEPTLTSLAGGGVMLHLDPGSAGATVCDFFSNAPGLGGQEPEALDFFEIVLDFGPAKQPFFIGRGAAAVPGVIPGLCTALERWGRLPLDRVVAPAVRMLREGTEIGPWQSRAAALLEGILLHGEAGRRQFAPRGRLIRTGDTFRIPDLADLLEELAAEGWTRVWRERLVPAMAEQFGPDRGGLLSIEDLRAFEVRFREPLVRRYREVEVRTNPPPADGGAMLTLMLSLVESLGPQGRSPQEHDRLLCQVMRVADEARAAGAVNGSPGSWQARLLELVAADLGAGPAPPGGPGSTTHVSAIDDEGRAAGVTFSYGEGNGSLLEGTGIMMNNLMGELDLHPEGFHRVPPGQRLGTMMAPTVLRGPDGTLTVLGTGGANRIRTALLQVISHLEDGGRTPAESVEAPRLHFEDGVLNAEVFGREDGGAALATLGAAEFVPFDEPNLFFGGVHVARRTPDGRLSGAGDPRRGGALRIV